VLRRYDIVSPNDLRVSPNDLRVAVERLDALTSRRASLQHAQ